MWTITKISFLITLACLSGLNGKAKNKRSASVYQNQSSFDIVIYGGTPAGLAAAIQVARLGKTVAIIEPDSHIGGIIVNGLGGTDIDNHKEFQNSLAVGGIALEFYRKVAKHYGRLNEFDDKHKNKVKDESLWRFEPHVAEKIIKGWINEYPITLFLNTRLKEGKASVQKAGTNISHVETEDGRVFTAKVFIDATLEGDLLANAGVSTTWGRESNSLYGETKNGIQAETTYRQFQVKVDPYIVQGKSSSGVIPTIQDEAFGRPGEGDKSIQAFCFRMCLTKDEANRIPFKKPENYDRNQYEIYLRYLKAGGKLYTPIARIPNNKTDLGAWHDLSHNLYGMNRDYPAGNYEVRQRIFRQHKTFTQGLFYFLANDTEVGQLDAELQQTWKQWGLCKYEFTDNEGWPRQFYVRDGRRMVSDYVITEHHTNLTNPLIAEDPVAVAFWPPDLHSARRIVKDGYAYNEGFVFGGDSWRPFGISYRALVPRDKECTNLLTPTCPSSSHVAYGAIRIEFTYMAMGQACAVAAVLAIVNNTSVQNVNYKTLSNLLIEQNQIIDATKIGIP
ncbi:MAG: FAD-dependent oxidoreductase [Bacteroidota bacterium]|nr:FAD-dependent oxidoreductase [Bacteroidota bacterium]